MDCEGMHVSAERADGAFALDFLSVLAHRRGERRRLPRGARMNNRPESPDRLVDVDVIGLARVALLGVRLAQFIGADQRKPSAALLAGQRDGPKIAPGLY